MGIWGVHGLGLGLCRDYLKAFRFGGSSLETRGDDIRVVRV